MSTRRDFLTGAACLSATSVAWVAAAPHLFALPTAELFTGAALPEWVSQLAERHLRIWEQGNRAELSLEYASNPEWDFMGRAFLVLGLANLMLRQPADGEMAPRDRSVAVMDLAIEDTLATEASRGFQHFLMAYGQGGGWRVRPARSVFVDGEIAVMLAARLMVRPDRRLAQLLQERIDLLTAQMFAGQVLSGESYPDECWTFCCTFALVAMRLAEAVGVSVDRSLPHRWLAAAKKQLIHRDTGILVSSFHMDGRHRDGPEGSSLWLSASNLLLIDEDFAREQYRLGKDQMMRRFLGFGYAKEWPDSARGIVDVDSGPEIPLLRASPGSSGLALVGAKAFGDRATYSRLSASLELAAFPERKNGQLRYLASNQVGDAVALYAASFGPLWAVAARST